MEYTTTNFNLIVTYYRCSVSGGFSLGTWGFNLVISRLCCPSGVRMRLVSVSPRFLEGSHPSPSVGPLFHFLNFIAATEHSRALCVLRVIFFVRDVFHHNLAQRASVSRDRFFKSYAPTAGRHKKTGEPMLPGFNFQALRRFSPELP